MQNRFLPASLLPCLIGSVLLHGQGTGSPYGPDDAILLRPLLGKIPLSDSITAFPTPGGALVPLGELCRSLKFAIQVDAENGRAEGFFIRPERRFVLDLRQGVAEVNGKRFPLGALRAVPIEREIFVDSRLLEIWFPFKVELNTKAADLRMTPKEKLPIQDEWEREGKYADLLNKLAATDPDARPAGVFKAVPYGLADIPMVDFSAYWSRNSQGPSDKPSMAALVCGDLLWMSSELYLTRDSNGSFKDSRYTLFREDPNAELLGPLQATRVELLDILSSPALELAGALPEGRGVLVENYPLAYRSKFATHLFQGYLPDGWTVELYQNSALIGVQHSQSDGRYEFKDVPLRFGLNIFKRVFRGPFGEVREESQRIDIADDVPPPGAFYYRALGSRPSPSSMDSLQTTQSLSPRTNSLAEMEFGLTTFLSANAGVSRVLLSDGYSHSYQMAGLRSLFSHFSLQGNVAKDRPETGSGGTATEFALRTGYDYSSLMIQRDDYRDGFKSTSYNALNPDRNLRSETQAQWDATLRGTRIPVGITVSRDDQRYIDGGGSLTDSLRATFSYPRFVISPSLSRTKDLSPGGDTTWHAETYMTFQRGPWDIQAQVSADRIDGETSFGAWSALGTRAILRDLILRVGVRGQGQQTDSITTLAGLSKQAGKYGYGIDMEYSKSGGATLSLRFQASFAREPRTGKWISDARSLASQGALSLIAFKDLDGNKTLDPGEPIQKDVQFKTGDTRIENGIQDSSVVFKANVSRSQETAVRVDESSLEDPALQASVKAYRVIPRAGKVLQLDFPVAVFGEIDGTTRIRRKGSLVEFGGIELELLAGDGTRIRLFRTAYDGFFELRDLAPGDYTLRVSPEEIERLKIQTPPSRSYHIDDKKNLFEGQDFVIEPRAVPSTQGEQP